MESKDYHRFLDIKETLIKELKRVGSIYAKETNQFWDNGFVYNGPDFDRDCIRCHTELRSV